MIYIHLITEKRILLPVLNLERTAGARILNTQEPRQATNRGKQTVGLDTTHCHELSKVLKVQQVKMSDMSP